MTRFKTVSRKGPFGGISDCKKNTALLVPPRMNVAGMPCWPADEPIAGGVRNLGPDDTIKDKHKKSRRPGR